MNCKSHKDCKQIQTKQHKKWEELSKDFRKLCQKKVKQLGSYLDLNQVVETEEIFKVGQLLQLAFDIEQNCQVFDDTIAHTRVNMAHSKHEHEKSKTEHSQRGIMGFFPEQNGEYEDDDLDENELE